MDTHTSLTTNPTPAETGGNPEPALSGKDLALLILTGLLLFPLPAGAWHLWRRSTTAGELADAHDWLRKAPGIIDDAIKFSEGREGFKFSGEGQKCLNEFGEKHERQAPSLPRKPDPTLTRF